MHWSFGKKAKILSAIAGCVVVSLLVWFWFVPRPLEGGLALTFNGFTNGHSHASFSLTNRTRWPVEYWVREETRREAEWPKYAPGYVLHLEKRKQLEAKHSINFLIALPAEKVDWRISIVYNKAWNSRDESIAEVRRFLYAVNMNWIADRLGSGSSYIILGPEITN